MLARGDCLLPSHHHGVNAPGLLLRRHAETSSDPFGPHSPARSGWPRIGRDPHDEPVARFRSTVLRSIPDLHSPLRIFHILCGSQRSIRIAAEKLTWRIARFPVAPRLRIVFNKPPADHRSRFATSRPVRLFHEPLGTLAIMLSNTICVKQNYARKKSFPQQFIDLISSV